MLLCILVAAYEIESEPAISASSLIQLLTEAEPPAKRSPEQVSNTDIIKKVVPGLPNVKPYRFCIFRMQT